MENVAMIAVCGGLGCLGRYFISGWVYDLLGDGFPWGTLAVNLLGSLVIGLAMEFGLHSTLIPAGLRVGLTVGFMGGLTTFSTFSYETLRLLQTGEILFACLNTVGNVIFCLLFAWTGMVIARAILM